MQMKKYLSLKYAKENFYIIVIAIISFVLRFINLGYSDYQGDEIRALYLPADGQSFSEYIIDQRKGPVQFIITYLIKMVGISYDNQFLVRLPFAIAGFLAVIFFFKLIKIHFGKKVAFYSSIFFATNGFLVAFSRIAQYQSFVVFFMITALYFLSLANVDERYKKKGIYLGLIFWALSILSHYDGVFIFPFVFYLLLTWFKKSDIAKKDKLVTFLCAGTISLALLLSFYIPFVSSLSDETMDYWSGRISGDGLGKMASSKYLFTVYQPVYSIHIYTVLFILGAGFISLGLLSKYILKIKKLPNFIREFLTHTTELMEMIQRDSLKIYFFLVWIFVSVAFYEKFVHVPGTHIYNYLIPMFVVLAFGLITFESIAFKVFEIGLVKMFNLVGSCILLFFLSAQSYAIFVDNFREYPWEEENFLIWRFSKPNQEYNLTMFGFPYFRDWEGIRDFTKAHPEATLYLTNEKRMITEYYLGLKRGEKDTGFYIYIKEPQSFVGEILNEKALYWTQKYEPVYTVTRYGRDMVRVYIMEAGELEEIIEKGY